jgi:cell division protein FtsB
LILGLTLVTVVVHDAFGEHGFFAMRRTKRQIEETRQKIDTLNRENGKLQGQIEELRSDPRAVERIAREEMGLARPGEFIFRLPESPQKPAQPDSKE